MSSAPEAAAPPALERVLRRERWIVGGGLALLIVLAWAWLLAGAGMGALMGSMPGMGEMPMSEMPGMQLSWSATTWALMLAGFGLIGGSMRAAKRKQRLRVSLA